jgi:hypothetical protein
MTVLLRVVASVNGESVVLFFPDLAIGHINSDNKDFGSWVI